MADSSMLLPKEHGAYAQLGFPLATGLLLAPPPTLSAVLLALAAISFFLANEPLAILLGSRGNRLREREGVRAGGRARVLLGTGVAAGLAGLFLGWAEVWPLVLIPGLAAAGLVPLVWKGRQKTIPGELVVITAFSTLVLPLAASSGVDPWRAGLAAGVWWFSFALGTLEVHAIKARVKNTGRSRWTRWASPLAAGSALAAALWITLGQATPVLEGWAQPGGPVPDPAGWPALLGDLTRLLPPAAAALLPPAGAIFLLSLKGVHPRHLKRVGWTLVGVNTLTLLLLLQG